ncbi:ABC transporter substrate-binding protein [Rhodobacteraceae bacterium]|nr:ABC transporter substrate-binding protein [Paracoccaceae bacterium]
MSKPETYISQQAKRLSKGQIDRRRFVMSALASGVTMPTAMSLASRAEAATPKQGGSLRYGVADARQGDNLDPTQTGSELRRLVNEVRGDTLVEISSEGQVTPALAEGYGTKDGLTWVFDIRPGVMFHSGTKLQASDVVASLTHAAKTSPQVQGITAQIGRIDTVGSARVEVHLRKPHWNFAELLASPHLMILPEGTDPATSTDGTGAYRLEQFEPGSRAHLTRNPNDWRTNRGHFDSVTYRAMPDARLRQSAIMNGEVDVIDAVDPRALAMLSNMPAVQILETLGARHPLIEMRMDRGPFTDPHLRRALKMAVDRQAILDKVLLGHGRIAADAPFALDPDPTLYDPDHARWYLNTANVTGPVTLQITKPEGLGETQIATLVTAAAADVGLEIKTQFSETLTDDWQLRLSSRALSAEAALATYMPDAGHCGTGWVGSESCTRFGDLMTTSRASKHALDHDRLMTKAAQVLAQDGAIILPVWAHDLCAHGASLARPNPDTTANTQAVATHWWFA